MAKRLKKGKIVRREGINLFDAEKYSRILSRRSYGPGIHGPKGFRRRSSTFGEQLRAKQQLKLMFGLREKQFSKLVEKAMRSKKNTGEQIIRMLEQRLDNVVYRLKLATTRSQARQLVTHRHIQVNNKIVNIPSYSVKKGDVITVKESSTKNKFFTKPDEADKSEDKKPKKKGKQVAPEFPIWLSWDAKQKSGKVTNQPDTEAIENLVSVSKVVEFYSR